MAAPSSQSESRLLTLPAELRILIYEFSVADHSFAAKSPSITLCCKQTRHESLAVYYSQDFLVRISSYDDFAINRALRRHDRRMLKMVRSLTVVTANPWYGGVERNADVVRQSAIVAAGFLLHWTERLDDSSRIIVSYRPG
ncbi:hypothetical protein EJ03DRAFT_330969 [Teratosphaeria nubilosa]|uniref:F-box domain-containing protein n=1 Tax=Teratosphaeria nubilosa TaxID=161662 RepID=A0A6G1KXN9_9PEZI|nr:hypothetical protein EJ03DRAFT_330969 [Teratosphaeria nubilosa]